MTTMAPEAPPAPTAPAAPAQGKRGNVFTRKLGPLPMWAWLLIGIALILGYVYYRSKTSAGSSTADQTAAGTDASQVPQFVNQTYTTVQPPAQSGQAGTPGVVIPDGGPPTGGPGGPGGVKPPLKPDTRYTEAVGQGGITLATFAKRHRWSQAYLKQVEGLNKITARTRLKKGQRLLAPA